MGNRVLDKDRYVFLEKPAMEVYNKEDNALRAQEIEAFLKELKSFGISLRKLSEMNLTKKERSLSLSLALILVEEEKIWEKMQVNRRIPLKALSRLVEEPEFELKKHHDQILAYSLLLKKDKYPLIRRYLMYDFKEKEDSFPVDTSLKSGLALAKSGKNLYILTSQGQFMKIRDEGHPLGDVASGQRTRKRPNFVRPLAILIILAVLSGIVYSHMNGIVSHTIILKAEGEVKMDFNTWGNMIRITGINSTGRSLVEKSEFQKEDLDTVLAEILEQAYITETIKERSEVTILISGEPLPEDFFKSGKTHDRILSYGLDCKINNNGSFLYLE